jgi:hypothetical protein
VASIPCSVVPQASEQNSHPSKLQMASRNSCASHFRFVSTVKITVFSEVKPRGLAEATNFSGEFSANPEDRSSAFFQIVTVMPQPKGLVVTQCGCGR